MWNTKFSGQHTASGAFQKQIPYFLWILYFLWIWELTFLKTNPQEIPQTDILLHAQMTIISSNDSFSTGFLFFIEKS